MPHRSPSGEASGIPPHLACSDSLAGERSLHRYKMIVALDQSPELDWLRREMDRDWTSQIPKSCLLPKSKPEIVRDLWAHD